jgi:hypothetical protein
MSEFYRMFPSRWVEGTMVLSDDQELGLLRIVNAINLYDQPIRDNDNVLSGVLRWNRRKARRVLNELITAGKLTLIDGRIHSNRADQEIKFRESLSEVRAKNGKVGGIVSGITRKHPKINGHNPLTFNEAGQANTRSKTKQNRIEENRIDKNTLGSQVSPEPDHFETLWAEYPSREGSNPKKPARLAFARQVAKGINPSSMIEGAKRYRIAMQSRGDEGGRFVAQTVTWINQERWNDDHESKAGQQVSGSERERLQRILNSQ